MITATVLAGYKVQIVVDAAPAGEPWTVTGTWDNVTWAVSGGSGVGDGEQLLLVDIGAPLNVPVVYTFSTPNASQSAAPVTVVAPRLLLQALDGSVAVAAELMTGSFGLELDPQQELFTIPGRPRPVVRYSVTGDGAGALRIRVRHSDAEAFKRLVRVGAPVLYRTTPPIEDLLPVDSVLILGLSSTGLEHQGVRDWLLRYAFVDNPFAAQRIGAFSWDVFDDVMAGRTWSDFDAVMAGRTWDQFDALDWSTV